MEALIDLERRGWEALSTSHAAALAFYRRVLDTKAIMVLPGGLILDGRDAILDAIDPQPWRRFTLSEASVRRLGDGARMIVYRAQAERESGARYDAWVSTAYAWTMEQWRLLCHQQTPI